MILFSFVRFSFLLYSSWACWCSFVESACGAIVEGTTYVNWLQFSVEPVCYDWGPSEKPQNRNKKRVKYRKEDNRYFELWKENHWITMPHLFYGFKFICCQFHFSILYFLLAFSSPSPFLLHLAVSIKWGFGAFTLGLEVFLLNLHWFWAGVLVIAVPRPLVLMVVCLGCSFFLCGSLFTILVN